MARETMADLIARLRLMVNDPIGAGQRFSDDELQVVLDDHREDVRQLELKPADTIVAGGAVRYFDWFAECGGAWEAGATLQDSGWVAITADSAELTIGAWHFVVHRDAPLYVTGRRYDLNAAAADVVDMLMAKVAEEFDFSADGGAYSRSQKLQGLALMRERFRSAGTLQSAPMYRSDTR